MRVLLLLFCCCNMLSAMAGDKGHWGLSAAAYGGVPVFRSLTEPDHIYLKHYDAEAAIRFGAYYRTNSGWQFGLSASFEALLNNRKKTEAAIIQMYSGPQYLHKVTVGGDPGVISLMAELGKVFEAGKWRLTPFFRSSILYICPSGADINFYLKQKVPNEHYYKEMFWEFSDTSQQVRLAPLQMAGGLRVGYQLRESYELYAAVQYQLGTLTFDGIQRQTDFYGAQSTQAYRMQQQYSLLGLELGFQYRLFREKSAPPVHNSEP